MAEVRSQGESASLSRKKTKRGEAAKKPSTQLPTREMWCFKGEIVQGKRIQQPVTSPFKHTKDYRAALVWYKYLNKGTPVLSVRPGGNAKKKKRQQNVNLQGQKSSYGQRQKSRQDQQEKARERKRLPAATARARCRERKTEQKEEETEVWSSTQGEKGGPHIDAWTEPAACRRGRVGHLTHIDATTLDISRLKKGKKRIQRQDKILCPITVENLSKKGGTNKGPNLRRERRKEWRSGENSNEKKHVCQRNLYAILEGRRSIIDTIRERKLIFLTMQRKRGEPSGGVEEIQRKKSQQRGRKTASRRRERKEP